MKITDHLKRRVAERNIPKDCLVILNLFGSRLDKRDGLRLDKEAYDELVTICNVGINMQINKRKDGCHAKFN